MTSKDEPDLIGRTLRVLDQARRGTAHPEDLAGASIALQMLRERLVTLFLFPTFPEEREGVLRIGSWDSLPLKQREAYMEIKEMLGIR